MGEKKKEREREIALYFQTLLGKKEVKWNQEREREKEKGKEGERKTRDEQGPTQKARGSRGGEKSVQREKDGGDPRATPWGVMRAEEHRLRGSRERRRGELLT